MIFELLNNPIILYSLMFSFVVFFILYMWRKISGIESYVFILEKRINNMKKNSTSPNNDNILNKDKENKIKESFSTSDIIMNEVFNSVCSSSSQKCTSKKYPKYDDNITSFIHLPVANHIEDKVDNNIQNNEDTVKNIIEEIPDEIKKEISSELKSNTDTPIDIETDLPTEILNTVKNTNIDDDLESETTKSEIIKTISTSGKKLLKLDLPKLKHYCVKLNVPSDGTKNQIIERLLTKIQ